MSRSTLPDSLNSSDLEDLTQLAYLCCSVSHRTINMLSTIVSNAECFDRHLSGQLAMDPETDTHDPKQAIIDEAFRISRLLRNLMDYAMGILNRSHEPLLLEEPLNNALDQLTTHLPVGITCQCELDGSVRMTGSSDHLRLMFQLLLHNALESIRSGSGQIQVRLTRNPTRIEIVDNGLGLPIGTTPHRLLEPFFTSKRGHLGIGLSTAYAIWRAHGGNMQVINEPNGGCRVRLTMSMEFPEG